MSTVCIVAQLKNGKYWVGETTKPDRYVKDLSSKKSAPQYVVKHGFLLVTERSDKPCPCLGKEACQYAFCSKHQKEVPKTCQETVLALMQIHGKKNVRGTTFPVKDLSLKKKKIIRDCVGKELPERKTLYALQYNDKMFQVGTSTDLQKTLSKETDVARVHLTRPFKTLFDEDLLVEQLMFEFGVDQVRGGSYQDLDDAQRASLEKKFAYLREQDKSK